MEPKCTEQEAEGVIETVGNGSPIFYIVFSRIHVVVFILLQSIYHYLSVSFGSQPDTALLPLSDSGVSHSKLDFPSLAAWSKYFSYAGKMVGNQIVS